MSLSKDVAIIGVPVDLGAGRRGVDMGPSAVRYAGLREKLAGFGHGVIDTGNIPVPVAEQIPLPAPNEKLRYLEPLAEMMRALAHKVSSEMRAGRLPLIVGGDHSLSIGSIAGVAATKNVGVIWVDAHGDFNTADTTPSGNIHGMSLAALSGRGHPSLVNVLKPGPAIREQNIVLVGTRDLDPAERDLLKHSKVSVFTMHDIDKRGMAAVMADALRVAQAGTDGIHVSFDMDVLDPNEVPGVGTPVPGGISYREAHLALEMAHETGALVSLDLVEVNPILDRRNHTAELAVELVCSAFGKRIY